METTVDLLPLTTIQGEGTAVFYQDVGETIDTSRYESGIVVSRVLQSDATVTKTLTFTVEGSDDFESWNTIMAFTAPDITTAYLNRTQQPEQGDHLWRFIRWTLTPEASTVDWVFCGRVTIVLK